VGLLEFSVAGQIPWNPPLNLDLERCAGRTAADYSWAPPPISDGSIGNCRRWGV